MTNQYKPLPAEYRATGMLGVSVYALIIVCSVLSVRSSGIRSQSTRRFFLCVVIMACLELPRFIVMAVQGAYSSEVAYSFHIAAGVFFFAAFSIVCRQWSGLLQLGSYFRLVYGLYGLIVSNICFALVDAAAVIICCSSDSLGAFFQSPEFQALTFIEGVRNCVYSLFLSYYGVKLVRRFWQFSRIERQSPILKDRSCVSFACPLLWYDTDNTTTVFARSSHRNSSNQEAVFTRVVVRMTSVLILSSLCFLCRISMLVAKMVAVHASQRVTTPSFSLFGVLWFCLSDFIPRAAPSLAFIFLMSTKRPSKEIRSSTSHKHRPDSDDYQFVHLQASDSYRRHSEDGLQSLYFGGGGGGGVHSNTELMLKSDFFLVESPVHSNSASSGSGDQRPHSSYTSMPLPSGSSHAADPHTVRARSMQQPEDDDSSSDGDGDDYDHSSSSGGSSFYSYEWRAVENKIVDRLFSMLYFKTAAAVPPPPSDGAGAATHSDSSDDILV